MMTATCVPQGATTANDSCLGARDCAKQQKTNLNVALHWQATTTTFFTSHHEGKQRQQKSKHSITIKILHSKGLPCNDWFVQTTANDPPI